MRRMLLLVIAAALLTACGDAEPAPPGYHELAADEAARYETVYIAAVQAPTADADGFILLRNNWDGRADLGGWAIQGRNRLRIPLPPSTFVEPRGELRVHLADGDSDVDDLYVRADGQLKDWDRLRLEDASGKAVARFVYGR